MVEQSHNPERAVAVVGVASILPDAPTAAAFWQNVTSRKDSIIEVPPDRWLPSEHYDPDPAAPDKTYCKIGAFVRGFTFDHTRYRIPAPVAAAMDLAQQWMLCCAREALLDAGHPDDAVDPDRIGVIVANALGGEMHELTTTRILGGALVARALRDTPELAALPPEVRAAVLQRYLASFPPITADSMPGELGNVIAGRVTNALDLRGPNFTTDAACASSLAALDTAMSVLADGRADMVVTGGVDRTMSPSTFVKFAKIGALSPDGSRPFDAGANGFVMGEGCVALVLQRLADAERAGRKIYAVIRSVGASSDGRGKGITAPNPRGQVLAVRRCYEQAGVSPGTVGLVEAHGTSTRVGDVAETDSLVGVFGEAGLPPRSIAMGSVKSQIGHLKSAAGAAGLLKAVLAVHHQVLPATINVTSPNPNIAWDKLPFYPNLETRPWERRAGAPRRAAVSSFGFGGTNFHVLVEEHVPGLVTGARRGTVSVPGTVGKAPEGVLCLGAADARSLAARLARVAAEPSRFAGAGASAADLAAPERVGLAFGTPRELADKARDAAAAVAGADPRMWRLLRSRGVHRGSGPRPLVAFLFPGQGSQSVGMLRALRESEPEVRGAFDEADAAMADLLPRPLSSYVFAEPSEQSDAELRDTRVCQPAMLAADVGLLRLLGRHGVTPDLCMGHSLGEYAALVAAGAMRFDAAVRAVSARAKEMTSVSIADNGRMASVFAPFEVVERVLASLPGYAVTANFNSRTQTVIGGATTAIEAAVERFAAEGIKAVLLPVSHAFHTDIVAPASEPLRRVLAQLGLAAPRIPIVSNVTAEPYPAAPDAHEARLDLLASQIAAPVQFIRGLETLHRLGARVFVEVGPRKVLASFVDDVLGERGDVVSLCTNQPKVGERESFAQALAGLYAAGCGLPAGSGEEAVMAEVRTAGPVAANVAAAPVTARVAAAPLAAGARVAPAASIPAAASAPAARPASTSEATQLALGRALTQFLEESWRLYRGESPAPALAAAPAPSDGSVVVTGVALGLPGRNREVFAEDNLDAILRGDSFIEALPEPVRDHMAHMHVTRLVKGQDGSARMELINDPGEVLKLAGQAGRLDLASDFGVDRDRVEAFDTTTQLAVGAAVMALRDAGIPLVRRYKQTSRGTYLPDRWVLPDALADETGVIFASAFPGLESLLGEVERYHEDLSLRARIADLRTLRTRLGDGAASAIDGQLEELEAELARKAFAFDRRFLFRVLAMGHSQLAELIGARGPNVQVNAACASAGLAMSIADDWIRAGRCRRVLVLSADNAGSGRLFDWVGAGFLASGAATTEGDPALAALPFDRRRNGMIVGMGASGLVLEAEDAVRERGMRGIAELLATEPCNSAFHGTRLDTEHISSSMERLVERVEQRHGIPRAELAARGVFVSHETYTPARGGSAAAEIHSIRRAFGPHASRMVIANTKGMTGHAMGAGIEEAVAVKILETGIVPPVPNLREPDPELGDLALSRGGRHDLEYALRFAAGFGSQLVLTVLRKVRAPRRADEGAYQAWVSAVSGRPAARLEITQKSLRVHDDGPPSVQPARSAWVPGTPPAMRAEVDAPAVAAATAVRVAPAATPAPAVRAAPAAATPGLPTGAPSATIPAPSPSAAPAAPRPSPVVDRVMDIVSTKAGYPRDMLALDLDLEADLGIDTVKQAEIFSEIRAAFDLPRRDDLKLREYPTLGHLARLITELRPELGAAPAAALPAAAGGTEATAGAGGAHATLTSGGAVTPVAASSPLVDKVVDIVASKAGYPRDMLALDLDLEADLGIDTVKQAEIFAEVRAAFELPRRDDLKLREYPTLGHIVRLIGELRPELAPAAAAPPVVVPAIVPAASGAAAPLATTPVSSPLVDKVVDIVARKAGYPREMLALDLDLEADLGIDTVKQAEIFAEVRTAFELPRREDLKLREYPTLGHIVRLIGELRPELASVAAAAAAVAPSAVAPSAVAPSALAPSAVAPSGVVPSGVVPSALAAVAAAPQAVATTASSPVADRIVDIVARKAGYPREMLALDLDLEADLGIDTVKQAEIFAEVRTAFELPRREDLKLREYPTLGHIVRLIGELRPELAPAAPAIVTTPAPATAPAPAIQPSSAPPVAAAVGPASGRVVRRVPIPVLRPELAVCAPTRAALASGARVVLVPDAGGVAPALKSRLEARGLEVLVVEGIEVEREAAAWVAAGPVTGVYDLSALDPEPALTTAAADEVRLALERRVGRLSRLARVLYAELRKPGAFVLGATRLGGQHGYGATPPRAPLGGATTGLVKALSRELPDAVCKAVDFEHDAPAETVAEALVAETERDPAVVEVGHAFGARHTLMVAESARADGDGVKLSAQSVVLVTGAAGGITAAIAADLGARSGGTFHLTDIVPPPGDDPDAQRVAVDREGLKRELFERAKAAGERVTPAQLEGRLALLERQKSLHDAMRAITAAGGKVRYHQADVRDPGALTAVVEGVRATHGRIDVIVHAAGLERSRFLGDKPADEFDRVFGVKALGLVGLLAATADVPVQAVVCFSSVAGRFGNAGQTDYSAANDLLCKTMLWLAGERPGVRALAIDWTAWADVGMATRGSIPEMMRRAGIDMLPLADGLPVVGDELTAGTRGEVVIGKALGLLTAPCDATGGVDLAALGARVGSEPLAMLGQVVSMHVQEGLRIETALDPRTEPFLKDHAIDGVPVLPGVMGLEGFVEVARLLLPGHRAAGLEDVRFEAPFKFHRGERRHGIFRAQLRAEGATTVLADVTLSSAHELPNGEVREKLHFRGTVRLERDARPARAKSNGKHTSGKRRGVVAAEDVYRVFFHGPSYRVIGEVEATERGARGRLRTALPPALVADRTTLFSPRVLELCLQTAGVHELGTSGKMALPAAIERVVTHAVPPEDAELTVEVEPRGEASGRAYDARVVDGAGRLYLELTGYRTSALPGSPSETLLAPMRRAFARERA